jgi:hypothetical protein
MKEAGFNAANGSMWTNYYKPNGDMHGFDAQFRYWTYAASTGFYSRSDGRQCFGKGALQSCSGPPE